MGDGGVACVTLQHVMATISETLCGGNGGSNGVSNGNGFNSMGVNMRLVDLNSSLPEEEEEEEELEKNMDLERQGFGAQKEEFEKSSLDSDEWQLREGVKLQKLEENGTEESTSLNVELERQDFCLEKGEFENSTAGSDEGQKGEQVKLQKLGEWQKVEMENGKEESTSLKMELDGLHFRSEKGEFRKSTSGLDQGQQGERVKLQKLVEWKKAEVDNGKEESASLQPQQQYRRVDLVKEKFGLVNGKKRSSDVEEVQKGEIFKLSKGGVGNWGIVSEKRWKGGEVEKEEIVPEKSMKGEIVKGEVVKGEVVSEKWRKEEIEKGEFATEKRRNIGEIENGEIVLERWQMGDIESGEFSSVRVSKGEIEKGEFVPEKWQRGSEVGKAGLRNGCKEDIEKGEFIPDRHRYGEVEKGEIVSERRRKREALKQEFSSLGKGRKPEVEKGEFVPEKGWKDDLDHSPKKEMPQSLKYAEEEFSQQKDCNRSCIDRWKRSNRWTSDSKSSSRTLDGENESHKHDHVSGKNHAREYTSQSSSCKHHGDFGDHSASKSGRVTDDNNHSSYPEKLHLHRLVERSNRNSSSLKDVPLNRYSRHYDSYSSSRGGSDRHRRSPGHHKQSPRERTRYKDRSPGRAGYSVRSPHKHTRHHDHRDRIPGRLSYLDRSPREWARHRDDRDHTPGHLERSPYDRARHRDRKEHSPGRKERSPHDRARHRDHREHSPAHSERSPRARARHHDRRDPSPIYLEQSSRDRGRSHGYRETKQKSGCQKQHSQCGGQGHEEKLGQESGGIDSDRHSSGIQSNDVSTLSNSMHCPNENVGDQASKEKGLHGTTAVCNEFPSQDNEILEELPSMEEDMDICDTPPHVPAVLNSSTGKWFYFNHFGIEQGPSKLCDLRRLVEEGFLQSDHLIKHSDINRWVTVEKAASPLVPVNLPSIVSDTVTELVTPPEAPGNLLGDVGDVSQPEVRLDESPMASESLEDLQIDERVKALLDGYTLVPGMELETLGEALHVMFEHADWERWSSPEGFSRSRGSGELSRHPREEEFDRGFDSMLLKETVETRLAASSEEISFLRGEPSDWFASLWSCKGGDWKRNDEVAQDRCFKRKLVLNNGYPLCLMPKSGYEDPRGQRKDDLYYPSCSRKLDLPQWAFTLMDEKNDTNSDVNKNTLANRSGQLRPSVVRGVKGTVLPVTRINACVVKDYGSSVSEPHAKVRESERHVSRFIQSVYVSSGDGGSLSTEAISRSIKVHDRDLQTLSNCRTIISIPKDHVCTVDELQLEVGDWYYLDGAGHEHGPLLFSELQTLASQGIIPNGSSAFRKIDKVWVPISTGPMASGTINAQPEKMVPTTDSSAASYPLSQFETCVNDRASSSFHNAHPQFIGYTRGKLHELVMKSYRSREFAAAINEVLDPWISTRQAKKETDKHFPFNSSIMNDTADLAHGLLVQNFRKPESGLSRIYGDCNRAGKRPRLLFEESDKEDEMEEDLLIYQKDECSFEDLCGEAASSQAKTESCGLLSDHILARVFHFLRSDLKSLAISASTCRCWNTAIKFYRDISRQVDLSSLGSNCTDSIFQNIMSCYNKTKITSIGLIGCTNVSAAALEEALHAFPCITSVDIRGCNQFHELRSAFKDVKWIGYRGSHKSKNFEESHSKMKGLKQIPDKSYLNSFSDDSNLDRKDSTSYAFRQSSYRRTKFLNARKFSAVLSRDVHLRRLLRKKSENGYKRMEEFLSTSLKDIMKENKSEFFIPKVAEIEDRMRNGYYIGHGLSFVKDDISRMCRDAIKAKNRVGARDMNHIIMLFIRLAKSLEENAKSSARLSSAAFTYKKKRSNVMSERKAMNRSNGTSYANGGMDHENYASDREIRRRLSKLNRRSFDSESETSDDLDLSEDDGRGDAENSNSDTESDLDLHSEGGNGDLRDGNSFLADESLESMIEDREWGARMTKVSLVPPVTRKYEVIDHYVIVADEEEVQRKMQVALPDDYTEKLRAQKNGIEESDMEIPEVKDYKPRKRLGDEVLEQEVYGIDPYTHNLLLDSMPEELEWPHLERHLFIEEVLLCALNKQVRYFTGTGSTPMVYPLQPVLEEIRKTAEEEGDTRVMKMCQGIVKAMHNRPEDNYVAYRKGLGVLCNKEEGFAEDDFVVEFLGEVYPAWKWFEKQDGIRSMQKNNKDPAPEFYNIYLERPKGDCDGYDLVVVDAMHKANYASRICHSCRPNCEAKVTAVDGQYQIGIYTVRPIRYGEEITFDYNSVTESKEEYEASVCLCGSQVCRGSYLNLTGEGAFQKVIKECHGLLDRHQLMLEACELNYVSQEDYIDLGRAGFGTCLLAGLPDWLIAYSAHLVRFINFERTKLPDEILKHNLEEKKRFFTDICLEVEKSEAEIQAEGVYNQRLQNLALTLDKVRYVMRCVFGDPRKAPPPLEKISPEALVSVLWKGEDSLVQELLQCMAPHMEADSCSDLKSKIGAHDPSGSDDLQRELKKSLLWLRDEIRNLPCTYKCRHDAAADLIHMYAHTKCFFKVRGYKSITSPPVYISPLDLGPKYADKLGTGFQEYCKTYGENYCLGQLIYWHIQTNAEPDCNLARARRGCLSLPDIASFYVKSQKPLQKCVYGPRTIKFMLSSMEKYPQRTWPKDRIWTFKSTPRILGSPMLDAVFNKSGLDMEMVQWLKSRPFVFQATWDR